VGANRVGWLPQNPALALNEATVAACLAAQGITDPERALAELGLSAHLHQGPHELSGGEQRRLALLLALANDPAHAYLDEPTVGQDRHNWLLVVRSILAARSRGVQVMVATHDPMLTRFADRVEVVERAASAGPVSQANPLPFSPLALLAASFTVLIGALNSTSLAGLAVAVGAEAAALAGLATRYQALRRPRLLIPILIGVASVGFSNWWLSASHQIEPAAIAALRVLVFGLPGLLFAAAVAPSVLGDQLGQTLQLPARPVVAAMVGLNRVHQLAAAWSSLALVRRAHGVTKRNRLSELLVLTTQSLVAATKSAETASVAMEARGFSLRGPDGRYIKRTWAVPALWLAGDLWFVLCGLAVAAVAICVRL